MAAMRPVRLLAIALAALLALLQVPRAAFAHDLPDQIILHGYVKPEGERLHFLVRVPLVMLLNLNLPKRGPGFIALDHADEALQRAAEATARELVLYEDGERLLHARVRTRISPPSDRGFAAFDSARALLAGPPLEPVANVFWNQGYFDAHYEMPIRAADSSFALDVRVAPGLRDRLKLVLRFLPPNGASRVYELHSSLGPVHLDPRWYQAAGSFVRLGTAHILDGVDHLLFLLCLVLPYRRAAWLRLVGVVTAFTAAHSVTLVTAALGGVPAGAWFPPLVETLIAASILYVAIENFVGARLSRRWLVTALFGLVHGFGFSFALSQDLQLAGGHHLLSLLAFNVGVEIGQLLFIVAVVPGLWLLDRFERARRPLVLIVSAFIAHTAWHWSVERYEAFSLKPGPEVEPGAIVSMLGWTLLAAAVVAVLLFARNRASRTKRGIAATGLLAEAPAQPPQSSLTPTSRE